MALALQSYMDSLPENDRQLVLKQQKHSSSVYTLDGRRINMAFDREDLLSVLMTMER